MALGSIVAGLVSFIAGSRLVDGSDCLTLAQHTVGINPDVTAKAGGTGALATPISYGSTRVSVVASGSDSILLPPAIPGGICTIYNGGAQTMKVFGQQANQGGLAAGDQVIVNNSVTAAAVATGVDQASATVAIYRCFTVGLWKQMLSA